MYTFTNKFNGSELRQRVGMMNRPNSSRFDWMRYVVWTAMLGLIALACQHSDKKNDEPKRLFQPVKVPATNATRTLAGELDDHPSDWKREGAMIEEKPRTMVVNGVNVQLHSFNGYPRILRLHDGKLALHNAAARQVRVFVNGQEATIPAMEATSFAQVSELFIYRKQGHRISGHSDERYRVLLSTTHITHQDEAYITEKKWWKTYMEANDAGGDVYGDSHTFSMNQLLEATFFHDQRTFVERTKDNHLALLEEYNASIDLFINGLPVTSKDIEAVHIREVDKLYTRERPFKEWNTGTNPPKRYILYIETAPKRAKRDSSYYVFSPFYSGDF